MTETQWQVTGVFVRSLKSHCALPPASCLQLFPRRGPASCFAAIMAMDLSVDMMPEDLFTEAGVHASDDEAMKEAEEGGEAPAGQNKGSKRKRGAGPENQEKGSQSSGKKSDKSAQGVKKQSKTHSRRCRGCGLFFPRKACPSTKPSATKISTSWTS